jgi:hypothetical protein
VNVAFGARTNWGKSYVSQGYTERNDGEVDRVVVADYKDEYAGLVEAGFCDRLPVDQRAAGLGTDGWGSILDDNGSLQVARDGLPDDDWRQVIADLVVALSYRDERVFLLFDEAHRLVPQRGDYPDAFDTLATTWHGDGMVVVWVTQRWAKLDEDILSQCNASMLGGFGSGNDLDKVAGVVEYPPEVHKADAERCTRTLPDALLVDGDPLTVRRFTDDEGNTTGSEWIYSDDTTLRRLNSGEWDLESTHYGSDRVRISHPFE